MMGVSRADALQLSLWEYEARLYHWNEAHGSVDDEGPDHEVTMAILERANMDPRLTH